MLHELRIENLLLLERAELRLAPGLNVLTGETGAGKTLLAQALDLLLGGRAGAGIVREGSSEAYVEGVFEIPADLDPALSERIPGDCDELVLARRVWPDGRTRAYVAGRAATVADLRELGSRLLAFYGQHEHRRLMLASAQLEILDELGGDSHRKLLEDVAARHIAVRELRGRVAELEAVDGSRERELDLLSFELDEIDAVAPSETEEAELMGERSRLRGSEALRGAAAGAAQALSADDGAGVLDALAQAEGGLQDGQAIDPALGPLAERLTALRLEAEDLAAELRSYGEAVEAAPGRLAEVEERLTLYARLTRKHGGTVAEVLTHAERCRARRDELQGADDALARAQTALAEAERLLGERSAELTARRRRAAKQLAAGVAERLGELAMPDASFAVEISPRPDGPGARGADAVEFLLAPNPGLPSGALREIASGGELSRVMLALLSVAHEGAGSRRAEQPLLVFDEIDAGIGGHTARAVGEQLRRLAEGRQILCITHLPQVAALGARHFTIAKDLQRAQARTTVRALDGDGLVGELVRMLGAGESDKAAKQHARQLLRAA